MYNYYIMLLTAMSSFSLQKLIVLQCKILPRICLSATTFFLCRCPLSFSLFFQVLVASVGYIGEGGGGSFIQRIVSRIPFCFGSLLLKLGKLSAIVNGDQQLPN